VAVAFLLAGRKQFTSQLAVFHNCVIWFSIRLATSIRDENLKATLGGRQVKCGTEASASQHP